MKLKRGIISVYVLLACFSYSTASAQGAATAPQSSGKWEFSVSVGHEELDSETAYQAYIEDNAWSIGISADYDSGRWLSSIGLGIVRYRDDAGFTQGTVDGWGDYDNSESTASGTLLSFAIGPRWKVGADESVLLYTQAGLGKMFESSRSIANCSNCYEEDIDLESGLFARFGLIKELGSFGLGFSLTQYLSGDGQDRSLSFIWSTAY